MSKTYKKITNAITLSNKQHSSKQCYISLVTCWCTAYINIVTICLQHTTWIHHQTSLRTIYATIVCTYHSAPSGQNARKWSYTHSTGVTEGSKLWTALQCADTLIQTAQSDWLPSIESSVLSFSAAHTQHWQGQNLSKGSRHRRGQTNHSHQIHSASQRPLCAEWWGHTADWELMKLLSHIRDLVVSEGCNKCWRC